jgi:hypothetical protein
MSDPASSPATPEPISVGPATGPNRRRRVLSIVVLLLACLSILTSTLAVWTHQVALNTNRFTSLVEGVVTDPALIAPISARVSAEVVEALDVQTRIADTLPGPSKVLAPVLANAVEQAIDKRLQVALANPRIQQGLITALSLTHEHVVALLRDKGDATSVVDGYVVLNVFPIVGTALTELQSMGIIPASVQLPDLSSGEAPDILSGRVATALGITLKPGFGTIQLMPADRLVAARNVVRIFDIVVIVLLILTAILIALALWLATSKRNMVIALGIGTIVAFLIARVALNSVRDAVIGGIADDDLAGAMRTVVDAVLADLRSLTILIVIATAIVAIAAYLWGRPQWLVEATAAVSGAASSGAASSGAASSGAPLSGAPGATGTDAAVSVAAQADAVPSTERLAATARANRVRIERSGLVAIAFVVLWLAVGLGVALLGLALVIAWELIVVQLRRGPDVDEPSDEPGADLPSAP